MPLFTPIRYINDGEPLNQITLNRGRFDVQENIEELFSRVGTLESVNNTSINEDPDTIALRNSNGTTSFSEPTAGTHPLRLDDASVESLPDTLVMRDSEGKSYEVGNGLQGIGSASDPTRIKLDTTRSGNLLQLDENGLFYGIEAPPDLDVLYISTTLGDDSNSGTRENPLATINEAFRRLPTNVSSTIRLRAGETFEITSNLRVRGAERVFEPYDDPYYDGNLKPELDSNIWYYDPALVDEVNRPNIIFKWYINTGLNTAGLFKLFADDGGGYLFRACRVIREGIPTAGNYPTHAIAGSPARYNGTFTFRGCELVDNNNDIGAMFSVRDDSGALTFSFTACQATLNGVLALIDLNGGTMTINIGVGPNPTPNPVSGISKFSDTITANASDLISGIVRTNGVPVNVVSTIAL